MQLSGCFYKRMIFYFYKITLEKDCNVTIECLEVYSVPFVTYCRSTDLPWISKVRSQWNQISESRLQFLPALAKTDANDYYQSFIITLHNAALHIHQS